MRTVVKFHCLRGKTQTKTLKKMKSIYNSVYLSQMQVFTLHKEFLEGRETADPCNIQHNWWSPTVSTKININTVRTKPVCILGHTAKVKLRWTQLYTKMSKYIWTSVWIFFFFWNFLKFFQELSLAYIFINCTNLSKFVIFVKIVFDSYLNFIKLPNISKIFRKVSMKF